MENNKFVPYFVVLFISSLFAFSSVQNNYQGIFAIDNDGQVGFIKGEFPPWINPSHKQDEHTIKNGSGSKRPMDWDECRQCFDCCCYSDSCYDWCSYCQNDYWYDCPPKPSRDCICNPSFNPVFNISCPDPVFNASLTVSCNSSDSSTNSLDPIRSNRCTSGSGTLVRTFQLENESDIILEFGPLLTGQELVQLVVNLNITNIDGFETFAVRRNQTVNNAPLITTLWTLEIFCDPEVATCSDSKYLIEDFIGIPLNAGDSIDMFTENAIVSGQVSLVTCTF